MGSILSLIFGGLGQAVKGFFGFKQAQADVVRGGLQVLSDLNTSNAEREQAIAQIIAGESQSGYWLAAVWRPLTMVIFVSLVIAYWFGFAPKNILVPMPGNTPLTEVFDLVKIGLCGYIPARTVEKIVSSLNIGRVLNSFIAKKLG